MVCIVIEKSRDCLCIAASMTPIGISQYHRTLRDGVEMFTIDLTS